MGPWCLFARKIFDCIRQKGAKHSLRVGFFMVTGTWSLGEESLLEAVGRKPLEIKWSMVCVKADHMSRFIAVWKSHISSSITSTSFSAINVTDMQRYLCLDHTYKDEYKILSELHLYSELYVNTTGMSPSISRGYPRAYSSESRGGDSSSTQVPQLW